MAVKPEFRWWILTLVLVAILVGISLLAMDRPNVVWQEGKPFCPHCRSDVNAFSTRCPTCTEQYDWTVAQEEDSPLSPWSLSALEAKALVDRILELGDEVAASRVAKATGLSEASSLAYLQAVGRGRCGYCGGTGNDLAREADEDQRPCRVCLGRGGCIACGGDRRMRIGDETAARAYQVYREAVNDLPLSLPAPTRRKELRDLGEQFLRRHPGTVEATRILDWSSQEYPVSDPVVGAARARLDAVLEAVAGE